MNVARTTPRVGIDFEQTLMAAAQVKGTRNSQVLTGAAVQPLPEGLVFEGEVVDVAGLASQLKSFWKKSRFVGRRVQLGVANQKIVVRTMEFPVVDERELRAAVEFQAQEHIPIPVEEAVLDYQITSTFTADDGTARQRILLVAAQRDMIQQFVEVARKAGLTVEGIDLQAFALARALSPRPDFLVDTDGNPGDATALVSIGSGITNLVVVVGDTPQFTRVISLGSESLIQSLATDRAVDIDEAWRLAVTVGLPGPAAELPADVDAEAAEAIHTSLEGPCETFSDEIRRSVDYYHTQAHEGQITKVLLTGDGSLVRNMPAYLGQVLHLDVQLASPLSRLADNKSKLSAAELDVMAPRLAIAVGLALEDEV
jgi:type IV pilus assembly protein PilM